MTGPPSQPTQPPPSPAALEMGTFEIDEHTPYTDRHWKFQNVEWDILASVQGQYSMLSRPVIGTLAWEDQPTDNAEGYAGGPNQIGPVVLAAWIVDDPTSGFVISRLGVTTPESGPVSFEYTVDLRSPPPSTENRTIQVTEDVAADPPPIILKLEELLRTWVSGSAQLPFSEGSSDTALAPQMVIDYNVSGTVKPNNRVVISTDDGTLDPTANTSTAVHVFVGLGDLPVRNQNIYLKVCTDIGGSGTDGHLHDANRSDPCFNDPSAGGRPGGLLQDPNNPVAYKNPPPAYYPLLKRTGQDGKVELTYTSPQAPNPPAGYYGTYYISGNDKISAWLSSDDTVKDEKDLKTQVPNLSALPGSADCSGANISFIPSSGQAYQAYYFVPQQRGPHGCMFYGTAPTNASIIAIANRFIQAQIDCQNGDNSSYGTKPDGSNFKTPLPPKPLRITAMSLPWGGLLDINGDWNPPHSSHNKGRSIDISLMDFTLADNAQGASNWDMGRILLLKAVILQGGNLSTPPFPVDEGGDLGSANTTLTNPKGPHIHVNFSQ